MTERPRRYTPTEHGKKAESKVTERESAKSSLDPVVAELFALCSQVRRRHDTFNKKNFAVSREVVDDDLL